PSEVRGQIYIPSINWILMVGCVVVVLYFQYSTQMQSAYGLAITVDMLMTTSLLVFYYATAKKSVLKSSVIGVSFFAIEGMFLISNLHKFPHGGWFTFVIAFFFYLIMYVLMRARRLRERHTEFVDLKHYVGMLQDLQDDTTAPKDATNRVYLAMANSERYIASNILYPIFRKSPKRADVYWFLPVDTVDSPYTSKYTVETIFPKRCF